MELDLNVFQKYLIYERIFGRKILEKARIIILMAASYKIMGLASLRKNKDDLLSKLQIISNGVDSYWIHNSRPFTHILFYFHVIPYPYHHRFCLIKYEHTNSSYN